MNTLSEENYLKAIYHLGNKANLKISTTAIAQALGNNPASVVDMLKKLADKKLILYDKTRGARLSEKGLRAAVQVVRRHRLWEVFLFEKLGYTWDEVHDIAEQLEHIQQDDLPQRLEKYLGYPQYDPHGDPIPKSDGKMPEADRTTLSEVAAGRTFKVTAVKDRSAAFLQYLEKLKIGIGSKMKVLDKMPYDEALLLRHEDKREFMVSRKFSDGVLGHILDQAD
jgi:DtxR family transcriptional regulator, Mn-dependent transcriptional regulator